MCASIFSGALLDLCEVVCRVEASLWLVTAAQRCPLVRGAYLGVVGSLRRFCSEVYLDRLSNTLLCELNAPQDRLQVLGTLSDTLTEGNSHMQIFNALCMSSSQVGLLSFHQKAIHFLCTDLNWACQIRDSFSAASPDLKLTLVTCVVDEQVLKEAKLKEVIQSVLQVRHDLLT